MWAAEPEESVGEPPRRPFRGGATAGVRDCFTLRALIKSAPLSGRLGAGTVGDDSSRAPGLQADGTSYPDADRRAARDRPGVEVRGLHAEGRMTILVT